MKPHKQRQELARRKTGAAPAGVSRLRPTFAYDVWVRTNHTVDEFFGHSISVCQWRADRVAVGKVLYVPQRRQGMLT
jgi:hypothetical protein